MLLNESICPQMTFSNSDVVKIIIITSSGGYLFPFNISVSTSLDTWLKCLPTANGLFHVPNNPKDPYH
jgi:hypothetical protein